MENKIPPETKKFEKRIEIVILIISVLLVVGALVFQKLENLSYVDALYFATTTLTTVGFGDIHPTTQASRIFAIVYMWIGISITLSSLSIIAAFLFEKQEHILERRLLKEMKKRNKR